MSTNFNQNKYSFLEQIILKTENYFMVSMEGCYPIRQSYWHGADALIRMKTHK